MSDFSLLKMTYHAFQLTCLVLNHYNFQQVLKKQSFFIHLTSVSIHRWSLIRFDFSYEIYFRVRLLLAAVISLHRSLFVWTNIRHVLSIEWGTCSKMICSAINTFYYNSTRLLWLVLTFRVIDSVAALSDPSSHWPRVSFISSTSLLRSHDSDVLC